MVTAVIRSGISRVKSTHGFSGGKFSRLGRNFEIAALLMAAALLTAAALWGCSGSASAHPQEAADELAADVDFVGGAWDLAQDFSEVVRTLEPVGQERLILRDRYTSCDYDIMIYEGPGDSETLRILKGEELAYVYEGYRLYTSSFEDISRADARTAVGMDITADGVPNLVVSEWTGGRDGCYRSHIFELGSRLRKIAVIDGVRECPRFMDFNGDSSLEIIVRDWAFLGCPLLGADEFAPEVVFEYRDGAYWVAQNLMFKPMADAEELTLSAASMRADLGWMLGEAPTRTLCKRMLGMIYSGHAKLAWDYCLAAWNPGVPGREDFVRELRTQLANSVYFSEIDELNGGRVLCTVSDDK